jgi:hypothetical protein
VPKRSKRGVHYLRGPLDEYKRLSLHVVGQIATTMLQLRNLVKPAAALVYRRAAPQRTFKIL